MSTLFYPPHAYIPSSAGFPQAGAVLYFYVTATSTPKNTYSDFALTTPNANPVVADANGVWPAIYLASDINYRVTVKTALGVLIYTQDDVPGPLMTQAALGAILYPQIAAENGGPPTKLWYPYGNVLRFDADPTGVLDSTTAFLNASASSLTVTMPAGVYKLTAQIANANRAVTYIGAGQGSTFINCTAGSFDLFQWSNSAAAGGGISDCTFNCTGMSGGSVVANGQYVPAGNTTLTGQGRWTAKSIMILGGFNGFFIQDQNFSTLKDIWINGLAGGATGWGIKGFGSALVNNAVLDITNVAIGFPNAPSATSPIGLWLDGPISTINIRHLGIVNSGYGLKGTNSQSATNGPLFILGYDVEIDTCYTHALYLTGGTGKSLDHKFTDFYEHASATGAGIYLEDSVSGVQFKGGTVITNWQQGIFSNARYAKFVDMMVSINSNAAAGTFPGIQIGPLSVSNDVIGCLSGTWSGSSVANTNYGIQVDAGAILYKLIGNDLTGNTLGDINDLAKHFSRVILGNTSSNTPMSPNVLPGGLQTGYNGTAIGTKMKGTAAMAGATVTVTLPAGLLCNNAITAITKAASAVVTVSTGGTLNPFSIGQVLQFSGVAGMVEINGLLGTVTAVGGSTGAWTATVNINSSGFTVYTSGGAALLNYQVTLCANLTGGPFWVTTKTGSTFVINSTGAFTGNVDWHLEQ